MQANNEYEMIITGSQGYFIWGILFVVITILGFIGNIITIIVLKREPVMSTLTVLLIALSVRRRKLKLLNFMKIISLWKFLNKN